MNYQATIEKNKNILHVIVQKYIYSVPLFRLNVYRFIMNTQKRLG